MIDLDLVEGVLSHSFGVHDEPALGDGSNLLFHGLLVIIIVRVSGSCGEDRVWFSDNFEWLKFSIFADWHKPPVIEPTFPELAEIQVDLHLDVVDLRDVSLLDFMPSQQVGVVTIDRRRSS